MGVTMEEWGPGGHMITLTNAAGFQVYIKTLFAQIYGGLLEFKKLNLKRRNFK